MDVLLACGGRRALVVEDEYLIAHDLADDLRSLGADVVGPLSSVTKALAAIDAQAELDGAILDINLQGEMVFPVADRLLERSIPFLFATGYDSEIIPERYADVPRCEKPVTGLRLTQALERRLGIGD